jgi:hypothetical protein
MCAEVCAMTGVVSNRVVGLRLVARLAALLLFGMTAAPWAVLAQSEPAGTGELRTADEEFSKQLGELKKTFSDLSKKFEDSAQTIDRLNSAEAARQEIEELRDAVGQLLAAVADNGTVWSLGTKASATRKQSSSRSNRRRAISRRTKSFCWNAGAISSSRPRARSGNWKARARISRSFCASCRRARISSTSCSRFGSTRGRST